MAEAPLLTAAASAASAASQLNPASARYELPSDFHDSRHDDNKSAHPRHEGIGEWGSEMEEVDEVDPSKGAVLSGAIKMQPLEDPQDGEDCGLGGGTGTVRLIDNIILKPVTV